MPQELSEELIAPELRLRLVPVAKKVFWWGNPEEWVAEGRRFLAQVMTCGDWDTVRVTWDILGEKPFRKVLENAPPGVFDERSWHYWHLVLKISPVPPLPVRKL